MIQALRDYQKDLYLNARRILMNNRSVCIQSATGSGKTPLVSAAVYFSELLNPLEEHFVENIDRQSYDFKFVLYLYNYIRKDKLKYL